NVVTYTVVIKADNPDLKLKPGLTATISIYTLELKDVLTAEAKAINFKPTPPVMMAYNEQQNLTVEPPKGQPRPDDENSSMVWVLGEKGAISPKKVTVGDSDGVKVKMFSGIDEGNQLVYSLKSQSNKELSSPEGASESPFMPKPPGANKKK
ncbi:MAG: efflux RND transporter periplasmic adaptor subunit, partial [Arenibacter algicola]|nr:efflux RND transporter periplasmic adaptor subunit [Arenibacter algicola]